MTHKILHRNCPENLQNTFTRRSQISSYSTRNSHNLHLPKPRLEFTKKSFQLTGATAWNEILQKYRITLFKRLQKGSKTTPQELRWVSAFWSPWPRNVSGMVLCGSYLGLFWTGVDLRGTVFRGCCGVVGDWPYSSTSMAIRARSLLGRAAH